MHESVACRPVRYATAEPAGLVRIDAAPAPLFDQQTAAELDALVPSIRDQVCLGGL
ncbi:MAG: hypothetical protein IPK16_20570 [Anaerolineales bacterium]|nr:hypothetical protein [Anaerolineales bacterium]